jgi:hypothetical protein
MTVAELVLEKQRLLGRDVAFDLLLENVSRDSGQAFLGIATLLLAVVLTSLFELLLGGIVLPSLIPASAIPAAKVLMALVTVLWLSYAMFSMWRRSRIERQMLQAQINLLRLQQLAAQL